MMEYKVRLGDKNRKMEFIGSSLSDQNSSSIKSNMIRPSWSDLPIDLLDLILKRLGAIKFTMCACVCKSWRSVASGARKKEFMDNQPPLILEISKPSNVCRCFSLFSHAGGGHGSVTYKRRLPSNTFGKTCVGYSCGYLFMQDLEEESYGDDDSQLLLVNPFTGHELHFPSPCGHYDSCHFLLATCTNPYPQFVVIAFSSITTPFLQFCRYGDDSWTNVDTGYESRRWIHIEDLAVYEGKAYVLTGPNASIGVLNLDSPPPHLISMMKLQGLADASRCSHQGYRHLIAASDRQQLLLAHGVRNGESKIYRLDFSSQQWIKLKSIGDQTLFLCQSIKTATGLISSPPTSRRMMERSMDVAVCQNCCYDMVGDDDDESCACIILVGA